MARISITCPAVLLAILMVAGCREGPTDPTGAVPQPGGINFLVVDAPNTFIQVSAGGYHTCALRNDGVVECGGNNPWGEAPATKVAASGIFTQVSAAAFHSCAVRNDGVVECWGDNGIGQAPATKSAASGSFTQVSAGHLHSCAVRSDGVVECWGANGYAYGQAPATRAAASGTFTEVSVGEFHSCARRSDGVVECWGSNASGEAPATRAAASGTFTQVSAGLFHNCALRSDGVVECWGDNGNGQAPGTKAAASGSFTQISAGDLHSCALRTDGTAECWGEDFQGQAPATKAAAIGTFTQVSAGGLHSCALRTDGVGECWGSNSAGQAPAILEPSTTVHVFPKAEFSATPNSLILGESFSLMLFDVEIEAEGSHTFTYAFDCGDGAGYGAFGASNTAVCTTSTVGTRSVKGMVRDEEGDGTEYIESVLVMYNFGGFVGSVDAPPVFNVAKAGSAVPATFSLGGNQGVAILATGYPKSQPIGCDASSPADPIEETVTAGSSSLSYDASTALYTYVWKTDKVWANTCRVLTVRLADGTDHTALFRFSK